MGDGVGVETDKRELFRNDAIETVRLDNQTAQGQHPEADADGVLTVTVPSSGPSRISELMRL